MQKRLIQILNKGRHIFPWTHQFVHWSYFSQLLLPKEDGFKSLLSKIKVPSLYWHTKDEFLAIIVINKKWHLLATPHDTRCCEIYGNPRNSFIYNVNSSKYIDRRGAGTFCLYCRNSFHRNYVIENHRIKAYSNLNLNNLKYSIRRLLNF